MTETQKRLAKKAAERVKSISCSPPCDYHFSGGIDNACSESTADYQQSVKRLKRKVVNTDSMHSARDLRKMLFALPNTLCLEDEEAIVGTFKDWLIDMQHEKRVARDLEAQKVIQDLIDRIK